MAVHVSSEDEAKNIIIKKHPYESEENVDEKKRKINNSIVIIRNRISNINVYLDEIEEKIANLTTSLSTSGGTDIKKDLESDLNSIRNEISNITSGEFKLINELNIDNCIEIKNHEWGTYYQPK